MGATAVNRPPERSSSDVRDGVDPILIVCGAAYVSGKEIMSLALAEGLRGVGFDVSFVTSSWNDGDFQGRLGKRGIEFVALPVGFISATLTLRCVRMTLDQLRRWPQLVVRFARVLRHRRPSRVVHTNWHHLLVLWPFLSPSRDIFWCHEVLPVTPRYRRFFSRLSPRLAAFVAVSDAVRRSLVSNGVCEQKVRLIYNGVHSPSMGLDVLESPPLNGAFRVGICGQVAEFKGHTDAVDAIANLRDMGGNVELHIYGKGSERFEHQLRQRILDRSLTKSVVWHGFVAAISEMYANLDAVIMPSRCQEALGATAVEAALAGLPVVATRQGGLCEVVIDTVTGYLVDPANAEQLADRLSTLAGSKQIRMTMGNAARTHALARFDPKVFIREFSGLLEQGPPHDEAPSQ